MPRTKKSTVGAAPRIERDQRRHNDGTQPDQRGAFARDRDRILYSSAFRRLAGVTQVVAAAEGHLFHNRLTHTLKVAQLGRRLAENALSRQRELAEELGVDADVVEAAALAHDLGHPPFGHVGEYVLNECVGNWTTPPSKPAANSRKQPGARARKQSRPRLDGYEGNAQSFRIVTKLAVRHKEYERFPGLNLTRATLAAILKYPWLYEYGDETRSRKWSAYHSEEQDFDFACEGRPEGRRSVEAELMDWADDLAYSVHDLEDFHRAGMIPWAYLLGESREQEELLQQATEKLRKGSPHISNPELAIDGAWQSLSGPLASFRKPYTGRANHRASIRLWTSQLIQKLFQGIELRRPTKDDYSTVRLDPYSEAQIAVLKSITWRYVIASPSLAAQQEGQRLLLKQLFEQLLAIARNPKRHNAFPARFHHLLPEDPEQLRQSDEVVRVVADCIASMTEAEAIALHRRISGSLSGSVLDPIFR